MSEKALAPVLRRIRDLFGRHPTEQTADGALLERFVATRDEAAFAALVQRHGPMVWGACRRLLREEHVAEDAFQATFLVLAQKAGTIRNVDSLAGWLHRVAHRVALMARPMLAHQDVIQGNALTTNQADPAQEAARREACRMLDEEVNRLPEKYRLPVLLCFFEGRTQTEAATELRWPVGTVAGRLARAKELLHARLARRGVTLSAGALGALLAGEAVQAAPPSAVAKAKVALAFVAGRELDGLASGQAILLTKSMLKTPAPLRVLVGVVVLLVSFSALVAYLGRAPKEPAKGALPAVVVPVDPPRSLASRVPRNRIAHGRVHLAAVAFSPDGTTLASGGRDGLRLWSSATGRPRVNFKGERDGVSCLAFSPDGKTLATGSEDKRVRLWGVASGKHRDLGGHASGVICVAFSPDGKTLAAVAGAERLSSSVSLAPILLWDVTTGKPLGPLKGPPPGVRSVAFSPDGKTLAAGSWDGRVVAKGGGIKLWDVKTGKERPTFRGRPVPVFSLAYSPDGKTLVTGGAEDGKVRWFEAATGNPGRVVDAPGMNAYAVAFSPDGKLLAAGGHAGAVRLWEAATGKQLHHIQAFAGTVTAVSFTPDGLTLAVSYSTGGLTPDISTVRLWDTQTGKEQGILGRHTLSVPSVAYSPDGKTVAWGSEDKTVRLWDVATGKQRTFTGHEAEILSVAFSPDGKTLASASRDRTVRLWSVATGKQLFALEGHKFTSAILSVAFSVDGKTLALGGDYPVLAWEVATGKPRPALAEWGGNRSTVIAFSPDGKTLASGQWGGGVILWGLPTGKEVIRRLSHGGTVHAVAFSPDGKTLASGVDRAEERGVNLDWTIKFWEVSTGKARTTLVGHTSSVGAVRFSPDGKMLASASTDGTIKLWDAKTGALKDTLLGHKSAVRSLAFSPDGKALVSSDDRGDVLLWDVSPTK